MTPTNNSGLINRQIANKLIQDLFSYLFYFYQTSQSCLPHHLVLHQHQWQSCSISFLISLDNFVTYSISFFVSYNITFFVSINGFISCSTQFFISYNIWYQDFLFSLDYPIRFMSDPERLLKYLVDPRLSRLFTCPEPAGFFTSLCKSVFHS